MLGNETIAYFPFNLIEKILNGRSNKRVAHQWYCRPFRFRILSMSRIVNPLENCSLMT